MKNKFLKAFKEALEIDRQIELSQNFKDYEEWNSLSRLSLIVMLDEEFGVQIENQDFEKISTVQDLFEVVESRRT